MIHCTVGVLAHNEERNVQRVLHALLTQRLKNVIIDEILVVASGCTDSTVKLAQEVAGDHQLVRVLVETQRSGKASAIRRLISTARGKVIVLVGADTLPEPSAIEYLVRPFGDPSTGMTGGRVIPLNVPTRWLGFVVQMLWHVHHRLALRKPKLGEMVAFRNVIEHFPEDTSTDEPAIEALIAKKGFRLVYAPKAIVFNRGPETLREFVRQRRRVFAGQVRIAMRYGYFTASLNPRHVLPLAVQAVRNYPRFLDWSLAAMAVECGSRFLGLFDALTSKEDVIWRPVDSTKTVAALVESLTLISVKWPPGSLDSAAFLRDLQRLSEPAASVFWWDRRQGEILLVAGSGKISLEWVQGHIEAATRNHARRSLPVKPSVSCQLLTFSSPLAATFTTLISR